MDSEKKKQLEAAGFKFGTVEEFLNMEPGELDRVIIRNKKPIGVCDCKGKGKESCLGNGWIKVSGNYERCPNITPFE